MLQTWLCFLTLPICASATCASQTAKPTEILLCEVVYVVYCEPGIKEGSAREEFEEKTWNEHPHHSEVIAAGGEAVA